MTEISPLSHSNVLTPRPARDPQIAPHERAMRDAAMKLEATFLAEMLKAAGLGAEQQAFGGGAGESQFASFLRQAQAEEMAKSGGIGLAESLYQALKEKSDDD